MKLILTAFAWKNDEIVDISNVYVRCAFVSLLSYKQICIDSDVALITNADLSEETVRFFESKGICIKKVSFNQFVFSDKMIWSLAFYKLCALDFAVNVLDYDEYLIVDADTFCISSLNDMWREAKHNVMLYDLHHSASHYQTMNMNAEYFKLTGEVASLVNYGGEFICGSKEYLSLLLCECKIIYEEMKQKNVETQHGDEFILCSAAYKRPELIRAGNAYIYRFWTNSFYLVSTCYKFNQVTILHIPGEKETGFTYVYKFYKKMGHFPSKDKLFKMMGFPKDSRPLNYYTIKSRLGRFMYRMKSELCHRDDNRIKDL